MGVSTYRQTLVAFERQGIQSRRILAVRHSACPIPFYHIFPPISISELLSSAQPPSAYTSAQKAAIAQFVSFTNAKDSVAAKASVEPLLFTCKSHPSAPKIEHEWSIFDNEGGCGVE